MENIGQKGKLILIKLKILMIKTILQIKKLWKIKI